MILIYWEWWHVDGFIARHISMRWPTWSSRIWMKARKLRPKADSFSPRPSTGVVAQPTVTTSWSSSSTTSLLRNSTRVSNNTDSLSFPPPPLTSLPNLPLILLPTILLIILLILVILTCTNRPLPQTWQMVLLQQAWKTVLYRHRPLLQKSILLCTRQRETSKGQVRAAARTIRRKRGYPTCLAAVWAIYCLPFYRLISHWISSWRWELFFSERSTQRTRWTPFSKAFRPSRCSLAVYRMIRSTVCF